MLARTKFFLFILVLHCPPSLLLPLAQQDVASATKTNNSSVVLRTNDIEQLTPNNSQVTELIQQIDVKDKADKVVSNIHQVVISDPYKDTIVTSKTLPNAPGENAKSTVTASLNTNSSSILNGRTNLASVSTTLKPLDGENILHVTEPVITWRSDVNNLASVSTTLKPHDGENILHVTEPVITWRSDVKRKSKKQNKLKHSNINDSKNNNESSVENNVSDLLDLNNNLPVDQNDDEKSIFVLLNSGNIDGLSVNSAFNNDNLQTNSDTIINPNFNSKLLSNLINATINKVFSNILQKNFTKNFTSLNTKNIFLLLNSGTIKNIHISSPVLENIAKIITLKDRSRRHLNDTHTNNTTVESITLKQPDNTTAANYNNTDERPVEEISSAGAPAFRSLIPDKIKKLQQVTNVVSTTIEPNTTKDHNLVLQLSPESPPISIDLDQIPFNNILGGALDLMKRFKRNTLEEKTKPVTTDCKEIQFGKQTVKSCKKKKSNIDLISTPTRKSLMDSISNVLNMYDTVEVVCPLSIIVKLFTNQVIEKLTKNDTDGVLNKILSSFMKGNVDAITVASKELFEVPIPVSLRLQLVHGKTKEFMEMLSSTVDATLCSLT